MPSQIEGGNKLIGWKIKSSIALGEHCGGILFQSEMQIRKLMRENNFLYTPRGWPRISTDKQKETSRVLGKRVDTEIPETFIQLGRSEVFQGRLSPKEAVAVAMLMAETAALTQAYKSEKNVSKELRSALNLKTKDLIEDVIDGFSSFGDCIRDVARARDMILENPQDPTGNNKESIDEIGLFKDFSKPLAEDKMRIADNCCAEILTLLRMPLFYKIFYSSPPWGDHQYELVGPKREGLDDRVQNIRRGSELASLFYLETMSVVANDFPDVVDFFSRNSDARGNIQNFLFQKRKLIK